jgi:hypothetical protein
MSYRFYIPDNAIKFQALDEDYRIELLDLDYASCIKVLFVQNGEKIDYILPQNNVRIHIIGSKLNIYDYNNGALVKKERKTLPAGEFDIPIICLTGHSGGGTSIVAKYFKALGFHLGDDSGNLTTRKTHESLAFRNFVNQILTQDNPQIYESLANTLFAYNYQTHNYNFFKVPDLESNNYMGNGIGLSRLFPNIKFISVVKNNQSAGGTLQSINFNQKDIQEVRKQQYPQVEAPIFHLDYKLFFDDFNYVNKVLDFIGANNINKEKHDYILKLINFKK